MLYVGLTGTFLTLIQKSTGMVPSLLPCTCSASSVGVHVYIQVKGKAFKIHAKIEDVGLNEG